MCIDGIQESSLRIMKKRRGLKYLALLLCVMMFVTMESNFSSYAETTKEKLEKAEQQHQETKEKINDTKDKINDTKDNIAGLTDKKNTLKSELDNLNDQLTQVSEKLESLEKQIVDKQEEIEQTQEDLEEAKQTEADQYEAMKKRVQFMYEKKNFIISDVFFGGNNISEMLNRSEYIESLVSYDRKMMDEYTEIRIGVEETEAKLEAEKVELDKLRDDVAEQQKQVQAYVSKTASNIASYSGQIKNAQAQADAYEKEAQAYEAQAAQEAADIAALKKQLAEEIAKSKLAAQSKWRDISEVQFAEDDRYLLANLIYCEAGNQPYEGQVAVGAVVMNRVLSSVYPDTIVGVIYQNKQFSPVGSGRLALALAENRATEACYRAADAAMSGQTNVGTCVYFRTPIEGLSGIQIGGHIFY